MAAAHWGLARAFEGSTRTTWTHASSSATSTPSSVS
jgi:hypothetical protein